MKLSYNVTATVLMAFAFTEALKDLLASFGVETPCL